MSEYQQPAYTGAGPATAVPGRTLGIVGLVLDFFAAPIGLILSIVAKVQSNRAGVRNLPATIGIVLGIVFTVAGVAIAIAIGAGIAALAGQCAQLGPGVHHVNGVTYTCGG